MLVSAESENQETTPPTPPTPPTSRRLASRGPTFALAAKVWGSGHPGRWGALKQATRPTPPTFPRGDESEGSLGPMGRMGRMGRVAPGFRDSRKAKGIDAPDGGMAR